MHEKGPGTLTSDQDAIAYYKKGAGNGNIGAQRALDQLSALSAKTNDE